MKTRQDVEALKKNWIESGGIFSITGCEGFEDYEEELQTFENVQEAKWEIQAAADRTKEWKSFMNMGFHEVKRFGDYEILKVQGGWIYTYFNRENRARPTTSSVFVPIPQTD